MARVKTPWQEQEKADRALSGAVGVPGVMLGAWNDSHTLTDVIALVNRAINIVRDGRFPQSNDPEKI